MPVIQGGLDGDLDVVDADVFVQDVLDQAAPAALAL
jgi:hypothetical protein